MISVHLSARPLRLSLTLAMSPEPNKVSNLVIFDTNRFQMSRESQLVLGSGCCQLPSCHHLANSCRKRLRSPRALRAHSFSCESEITFWLLPCLCSRRTCCFRGMLLLSKCICCFSLLWACTYFPARLVIALILGFVGISWEPRTRQLNSRSPRHHDSFCLWRRDGVIGLDKPPQVSVPWQSACFFSRPQFFCPLVRLPLAGVFSSQLPDGLFSFAPQPHLGGRSWTTAQRSPPPETGQRPLVPR